MWHIVRSSHVKPANATKADISLPEADPCAVREDGDEYGSSYVGRTKPCYSCRPDEGEGGASEKRSVLMRCDVVRPDAARLAAGLKSPSMDSHGGLLARAWEALGISGTKGLNGYVPTSCRRNGVGLGSPMGGGAEGRSDVHPWWRFAVFRGWTLRIGCGLPRAARRRRRLGTPCQMNVSWDGRDGWGLTHGGC